VLAICSLALCSNFVFDEFATAPALVHSKVTDVLKQFCPREAPPEEGAPPDAASAPAAAKKIVGGGIYADYHIPSFPMGGVGMSSRSTRVGAINKLRRELSEPQAKSGSGHGKEKGSRADSFSDYSRLGPLDVMPAAQVLAGWPGPRFGTYGPTPAAYNLRAIKSAYALTVGGDEALVAANSKKLDDAIDSYLFIADGVAPPAIFPGRRLRVFAERMFAAAVMYYPTQVERKELPGLAVREYFIWMHSRPRYFPFMCRPQFRTLVSVL